MSEYLVRWEINVSADNLREAAEMALEIQRDPESMATIFEVRKKDSKNPNTTTIDLSK